MQVSPQVQLPPQGRDYRLDVLRGIANWAIFLDHIPNNVVNWITTRNYGFADAADLFIFISGYTVAFVYGRMMISRGFIIAGTRIFKRSWQIYVAHLVLFVIYIAEVGYLAKKYNDPKLLHEFNVAGFMQDPAETLYQGLILAFKPVNMDVLPLYIVLMVVFPPVLWALLRKPNLTLFASFVLYLAARHFGWNLAAYDRRMVCIGRHQAVDAAGAIALAYDPWSCVSPVCTVHHAGRTLPRPVGHPAALALYRVYSERQDQPRPVPHRSFPDCHVLHHQVRAARLGRI